jgi:hypothetical protein
VACTPGAPQLPVPQEDGESKLGLGDCPKSSKLNNSAMGVSSARGGAHRGVPGWSTGTSATPSRLPLIVGRRCQYSLDDGEAMRRSTDSSWNGCERVCAAQPRQRFLFSLLEYKGTTPCTTCTRSVHAAPRLHTLRRALAGTRSFNARPAQLRMNAACVKLRTRTPLPVRYSLG